MGWSGKKLENGAASLIPLFDKAQHGDGAMQALSTEGAAELTSWNAIKFASVQNPWYLLMTVPQRSLLASTYDDRTYLLGTCILALLAILMIVFLAMNSLVSVPLKALSGVIVGLGNGLFDFNVPGKNRRDEVGDIARAVERLQDSGLEIARLHEASGETEYLRQAARQAELDGISARFSGSIQAVTSSIHAAATTVETQSRSVSRTTRSVSGRLSSISKVSSASNQNLTAVAAATASLLRTIESIGDQIQKSKETADKVERHSVATDKSISDLNHTMEAIGSIANLITEVANQTNLIALNATIEAARAGETGRGFAVVANEIKELAKQTAKAIGEIEGHVQAVEKASSFADCNVAEMKQAAFDMQMISDGIVRTLDTQELATGEIRHLVDAALAGAMDVAQNTDQLARSSNENRGCC